MLEGIRWDVMCIDKVWLADPLGVLNSTTNDGKKLFIQSIGCEDKHGKEIYDGDIVKWDGLIMQVKWDEFGWVVTNGRSGGFCGELYMQNYEIIGNIYQNPELLK